MEVEVPRAKKAALLGHEVAAAATVSAVTRPATLVIDGEDGDDLEW